ncbi:hypothetical protein ACJX0J_016396, partial [Zea mays]
VIELSAQAGELCTRREYARWLVAASNCLSRNTFSKVYLAMYIDNVTELAFDDVTPEDPDFPFIQGLAEAGLISSKLSRSDMNIPEDVHDNHILFSPESPLSRQDLVSWKMALDKRQLPEVDRNLLPLKIAEAAVNAHAALTLEKNILSEMEVLLKFDHFVHIISFLFQALVIIIYLALGTKTELEGSLYSLNLIEHPSKKYKEMFLREPNPGAGAPSMGGALM